MYLVWWWWCVRVAEYLCSAASIRGATEGVGAVRARAPLEFHSLAKDIVLKLIHNTFYTWNKAIYYLILIITNIPTPPLKIT